MARYHEPKVIKAGTVEDARKSLERNLERAMRLARASPEDTRAAVQNLGKMLRNEPLPEDAPDMKQSVSSATYKGTSVTEIAVSNGFWSARAIYRDEVSTKGKGRK